MSNSVAPIGVMNEPFSSSMAPILIVFDVNGSDLGPNVAPILTVFELSGSDLDPEWAAVLEK